MLLKIKKEVLTKCSELCDKIKGLIEKIVDKPGEYEKDLIKSNSIQMIICL